MEYIGIVEKTIPHKNYQIQFLKQYNNRRHEFCIPNVQCVETMPDDQVTSILLELTVRRGIYTFPDDILSIFCKLYRNSQYVFFLLCQVTLMAINLAQFVYANLVATMVMEAEFCEHSNILLYFLHILSLHTPLYSYCTLC